MDRVAEKIVVSGLYKSLVEKRLNLLVREFSAELQISHVPGRLNRADVLTRVGNTTNVIIGAATNPRHGPCVQHLGVEVYDAMESHYRYFKMTTLAQGWTWSPLFFRVAITFILDIMREPQRSLLYRDRIS